MHHMQCRATSMMYTQTSTSTRTNACTRIHRKCITEAHGCIARKILSYPWAWSILFPAQPIPLTSASASRFSRQVVTISEFSATSRPRRCSAQNRHVATNTMNPDATSWTMENLQPSKTGWEHHNEQTQVGSRPEVFDSQQSTVVARPAWSNYPQDKPHETTLQQTLLHIHIRHLKSQQSLLLVHMRKYKTGGKLHELHTSYGLKVLQF